MSKRHSLIFWFFARISIEVSIHQGNKSRNRKCISFIQKCQEEALKSILIHRSTMRGLDDTCADQVAIISMFRASDILKHFTWYLNRHSKLFLFWVYVCGNSARFTTHRQAKCHGCISTRWNWHWSKWNNKININDQPVPCARIWFSISSFSRFRICLHSSIVCHKHSMQS